MNDKSKSFKELLVMNFIERENAIVKKTNMAACFIIDKTHYKFAAHKPISDEHPEIHILAHSSFNIDKELVDAVIAYQKRPIYIIPDSIILAHRQDILRFHSNQFSVLTPEQTTIAINLMKNINITEI